MADGTDVVVELQVNVGGTWVTYDRFTMAGHNLQADYSHTPNATQQSERHGQGSAVRPCTDVTGGTPVAGIYYISNNNMALVGGAMRTPETSTVYLPLDQDKFDEEDKGVAGDAALNGLQLLVRNNEMRSLAELGST